LRYKNCHPIGAYGVSFNKRTEFVYKTFSDCEGFFIRKKNWSKIMEANTVIATEFKYQLLKEYKLYIRNIINNAKVSEIKKLDQRADVEGFKYV
jgi:hypothetical protein